MSEFQEWFTSIFACFLFIVVAAVCGGFAFRLIVELASIGYAAAGMIWN